MTISHIQQQITPILEEYGIEYAGVFGSVARGEDTERSDIDILVRPGKPMGMFAYMKFIHVLKSRLQKKVDIVTESDLPDSKS